MKSDLFDYVFYLNRKANTPITIGSSIVSLILFFCIVDVAFIVQLFVHFEMPSKLYAGLLCLSLMGVNWYRYERNPNVDIMKAKWGNESDEVKSVRGTLIVIGLVGMVLFPILIGVLRHNLGYLK
jgi:hypothetical protein